MSYLGFAGTLFSERKWGSPGKDENMGGAAYTDRRARVADTIGSQCGRGGLGCHQGHRDEGIQRSLSEDRTSLDIVRPPQALWEVV